MSPNASPDPQVTTTQLPVQHQVRRLAGRRRQPTIQGVIAAAVLNFSVGALYAWSVFIDPISQDLSVSTTLLTVAFSAGLLAFAGVVTIGGSWAQRSPRRSAVTSALATLTAMVATGLATNVVWLMAAVIAVGAAGGLAYATATGVAAAALPRHRGLSLGFVVASGAAGPILLGPLASGLMALMGWRAAFAALGVFIAALMVGTSRWLRADVASGHQADARAGDPYDGPDRGMVVPVIWLIFLLGSITGLAIFGHAAEVVVAAGASPALGGLSVALLSAGDVTGRVLGSTAGDGRRVPALAVSLGLATAASVLLVVAAGPLVTMLGLVLGGAGYGAHAALVPAVTSDHVRRDRFSAVFGRVFTAWGVAAVVGPLGTAWILRTTGSYDLAFTIGAGATAVALATVVLLRRQLRRRAHDRYQRGQHTTLDNRMLGMRPAAPHTGALPQVTHHAEDRQGRSRDRAA